MGGALAGFGEFGLENGSVGDNGAPKNLPVARTRRWRDRLASLSLHGIGVMGGGGWGNDGIDPVCCEGTFRQMLANLGTRRQLIRFDIENAAHTLGHTVRDHYRVRMYGTTVTSTDGPKHSSGFMNARTDILHEVLGK